ncbi:MAG: ABC transporter substrate-binding protein [Anaerolineaceae bacterium]|nr:ABC transporter substrate-binding protein [Anaerolineaceae bacterium]MDD4043314.1 ABC transporter substrate-binding protein [Anaerolineaceae bacterium]
MKNSVIILIIIVPLLALSACQPTNGDGLEKITFNLTYIPNIQFAPVYVALEKGFFAEEGLQVDLAYGNEADMVALVGSNHQQFMVASGEQVLLSREQGLPVVSVAAWYKDYPVGVAALKESEISTPSDLVGKEIGLPGLYGANYIGMEALAAETGLGDDDYKLVSIGFTQVESLVSGTVDAVVVYLANEPVQLRARGYEINVIAVQDYIDLVGNCIVSNEITIENNPELVRKMVRAFRKAVEYTAANPEEAWTISQKYVDNLTDEVAPIQKEVLRESINHWQLTPETKAEQDLRWTNMMNLLIKIGLMQNQLDIQEIYTNEFLP